jgi:L-iditol 2-dehydrogenase
MSLPKVSRAAVLKGPKKIEIVEFPVRPITDDEMLIRVEGAGICGTDVHEYKGDPFGLAPVVLGHEGTGEIVALGRNVAADTAGLPVKVGDKIVSSVLSCGECYACRVHPEMTNLCDKLGVYGLMPDDETHLNGWFADYIIMRKGSTFFNVTGMSVKLRMLIEPICVAVHAQNRASTLNLINFDSNVVIQGCGPIGLSNMLTTKMKGVLNIIAVDLDEKRLETAKKFGATHTICAKGKTAEQTAEEIKALTHGVGGDFVFQCTGSPAAAAGAWKFIRRGGGYCEVGFFVNNGDCTINPHLDFCNKEVNLVGSWVYTAQEYPITIAMIKRAMEIGFPVEDLVTHTYPLERLADGMETNIRMDGIKIAYVSE